MLELLIAGIAGCAAMGLFGIDLGKVFARKGSGYEKAAADATAATADEQKRLAGLGVTRAQGYQNLYDTTWGGQNGMLAGMTRGFQGYLSGANANPFFVPQQAPVGGGHGLFGGLAKALSRTSNPGLAPSPSNTKGDSNNPWAINANPSAGMPQYTAGQLTSPSPFQWNTSAPVAPTLPSYQATDWNAALPVAPGVSDQTLGQVNPTLDIAGMGQALQDAYGSAGNQTLAELMAQIRGDQALSMGQRGMSGSSADQGALGSLAILRGQMGAKNAADALAQRYNLESSLRGEQRTGAMDAQSLLRQAFQDTMNRIQTGQQMTQSDVQLLSALAGQKFGMDNTTWQNANNAGQQNYQNAVTAANMGNQNKLTDYSNLYNQWLGGTQADAAARQEGRGTQMDIYNMLMGLGQTEQSLADPAQAMNILQTAAGNYGNAANAYGQIGANQMAGIGSLISGLTSAFGGGLFGGNKTPTPTTPSTISSDYYKIVYDSNGNPIVMPKSTSWD